MLVGQAFIADVADQLDSNTQVGAMAIRIDGTDSNTPQTDDENKKSQSIEVAKALESFCQTQNGIWGSL